MPSSDKQGKDIIRKWIEQRNDITTIVDLGPGEGTYPRLLVNKEYIWKAVEIWAPYIKQFCLDNIYDEIRVGDIRYMELPDGDCCIAGDVLEHMSKEDAIKVINKIDKQFKHVVLSIPINHHSKDIVNGNWFEIHKSIWHLDELNNIIPTSYTIREYEYPISIWIK